MTKDRSSKELFALMRRGNMRS